MEQNIIISNLNDFIFCPRSIYYHNIYSSADESVYHTTSQSIGRNAHKNIDEQKYSTKKAVLEGIDIYSEEFGVVGKIDLFDTESGILTERKYKIKEIYKGYYLQLYAQYFCLLEMGYTVKKMRFYSISDNKVFDINLPGADEKKELKQTIMQMRTFDLKDKFTQNINKCQKCIYRELCDFYTEG